MSLIHTGVKPVGRCHLHRVAPWPPPRRLLTRPRHSAAASPPASPRARILTMAALNDSSVARSGRRARAPQGSTAGRTVVGSLGAGSGDGRPWLWVTKISRRAPGTDSDSRPLRAPLSGRAFHSGSGRALAMAQVSCAGGLHGGRSGCISLGRACGSVGQGRSGGLGSSSQGASGPTAQLVHNQARGPRPRTTSRSLRRRGTHEPRPDRGGPRPADPPWPAR